MIAATRVGIMPKNTSNTVGREMITTPTNVRPIHMGAMGIFLPGGGA